MIIHPRVYVHRRLNQTQKAVLTGNYKLAVVVMYWIITRRQDEIGHPTITITPILRNEIQVFARDNRDFMEWIGSDASVQIRDRCTNKTKRLVELYARP